TQGQRQRALRAGTRTASRKGFNAKDERVLRPATVGMTNDHRLGLHRGARPIAPRVDVPAAGLQAAGLLGQMVRAPHAVVIGAGHRTSDRQTESGGPGPGPHFPPPRPTKARLRSDPSTSATSALADPAPTACCPRLD